MLAIYVGLYIFLLAILWGFFLIARHHSYKFKDFSKNITLVTNVLFVFLILLSVAGFFAIFGLEVEESVIKINPVERTGNISY